jgi:hypothetical protein
VHAKGAVIYATALRPGETEADQRSGSVVVLVEVDPKFDLPDLLNDPVMTKMTEEQARVLADEKFKSYHPDAVIEHDEEEVRVG